MNFTFFSLAIAILWVSFFVKTTSLIRKQMLFFRYCSIYSVLLVFLFCIIRLFFSFELPFTRIINSSEILPAVQNFICFPVWQNITLLTILIAIWFGIAIKKMIRHAISYRNFKRALNFTPATNDKQILDIFSIVAGGGGTNAKIVIHDSIRSPAVFGFYSPILMLPNEEYSTDELYGILLHEWSHFQYRHAYLKLVTGIICSIFWWNPIFHMLSREVAHLLELHSDKKVCESLNKEQQKLYLKVIARTALTVDTNKIAFTTICSLVEENNQEKLTQRFKLILEDHYIRKKYRDILVFPFIFFAFLLSYSVVFQPYSEPTHDKYGKIETVQTNDYLVETEIGYKLYSANGDFIADIAIITNDLSHLKVYN